MIRTNYCNPASNRHKGMTLIEITLVVAIIGILAAIAYPSYSDHVRKAHRKQAMADMAKLQLYLEEHYDKGYSANAILAGEQCGTFCEVDNQRYVITANVEKDGYLITGTPQTDKSQHIDKCAGTQYEKLTLSHTGQSLPVECWQ